VVAIPVMECLAAAAIVAYFSRDRRGMSVWRVIIAPAAAGLALLLVTFLIITQLDIFTTRGALVNSALVGVVFVALLAGILRALWLKQRDPAVYADLGRASDSEVAAV
jgi:peptidoglycan/LPS O-acetylase OafA/YrhL